MNYKGKGQIFLNNMEVYNCNFELFQNSNSKIFLLCNDLSDINSITKSIFLNEFKVKSFKGMTNEGFNCFTEKILLGDFPEIKTIEDYLIFYLDEIEINTNKKSNDKDLIFSITNFSLKQFESFEIILPNFDISDNKNLKFIINPLDDYKKINRKLIIFRDPEITSEIICTNEHNISNNQIINNVDDICYILSIATGNKIQWINYKYNKENNIHEKYLNRSTNIFSPLFVIPLDYNSIKNFVEMIYPNFVENKDKYNMKWVINAFLDAKSESIYTGTRALRAVIIMEMLRNYFLESANIKNNLFKWKIFKKIRDVIEKAIDDYFEKNTNLLFDNKDKIIIKICELNRRTFRDQLEDFLEHIKFDKKTEEENINYFIKSRNSLVHLGRFLFDKHNKDSNRFKSNFDEYTFIINFVDKVILKLIGYSGIYHNIYHSIQNGWQTYEKI